MFYLNSMLGNKYNSGMIQIDIPKPVGWDSRKKIIPNKKTATRALGYLTRPLTQLAYDTANAVLQSIKGESSFKDSFTMANEQWETYEVPTEYDYIPIKVFCTEDITVNLGNEWGSILPALGSITQFSQLGNEGNVVTWLSATKAAWKGCKPLTLPLTFYVFSLHEGMNALTTIEPMLEFAGIGDSTGNRFNFLGIDEATINVHGGYKVDPFQNNVSYIDTSKASQNNNSTFKVHLGDQVVIDNLLLGDIQVTHSNIYVDSGIPLYVKVQANFRTVGVPTIYDIKRWYGS